MTLGTVTRAYRGWRASWRGSRPRDLRARAAGSRGTATASSDLPSTRSRRTRICRNWRRGSIRRSARAERRFSNTHRAVVTTITARRALEWIARRSVHVSPSRRCWITVGAHGLLIALERDVTRAMPSSSSGSPTPGVDHRGAHAGAEACTTAIDAEGLRPGRFDTVARTSGARALVIQLSLHTTRPEIR